MELLLATLFSTSEYRLNNNHCRHVMGTCISDVDSKCASLFGYQPTYRELIEQRDTISLFDKFNVDLCFRYGACTDSRYKGTLSGICQLNNKTSLKIEWLPKINLTESIVRFSLETLLVQKEVAENGYDVVDYDWNSPYGMSTALSTVVCANGRVKRTYYEKAAKFCLDQRQPIKGDLTLDDVKEARNQSEKSSALPRLVFWSNDKWFDANQLIDNEGQLRDATMRYARVMPFDTCGNDRDRGLAVFFI